jgi:hypothetical protein
MKELFPCFSIPSVFFSGVFRRILDNDVPQNGDQVAGLEVKIYKSDLIYESHAVLPEMLAAKQSKTWNLIRHKFVMYEILHSA